MKSISVFIIIALSALSANLYAQSEGAQTVRRNDNPALKLDLLVLDFPHQKSAIDTVGRGFFGSYANPSMGQSLAISTSVYSAFHFGMKQFKDNSNMNVILKNGIYFTGLILGNYVLLYSPFGTTWLHEEYHRAMLTQHGVMSSNPTYRFPFGKAVLPIGGVTMEDFINMKEKGTPGFVRIYAAGIEGEYLLIDNLQRNNFFYNQKLPNEFLYWWSTITANFYFQAAANSKVGGLLGDMGVWAYDLHNPEQTYRGDGSNIALAEDARSYLKKQSYWHFLNFASPMLFGIRSIPLGDSEFSGNFAMRHLLTSFGTAITAQFYLKNEVFNMAFAYHSYLNSSHYFPAVEVELIDYPVQLGMLGMYLSPRIIFGMQPKDQDFRTNKPELLGLLGLRADFMTNSKFLPYIELTGKTNGWVAGNPYLNRGVNAGMGISARF